MKNPMDRQLEKRLSDRAVAIGREGNVAAVGELIERLQSSSANARRLSASALGKLAWMGVDQAAAVAMGVRGLAVRTRRDRVLGLGDETNCETTRLNNVQC